jgi:hypothetical protein
MRLMIGEALTFTTARSAYATPDLGATALVELGTMSGSNSQAVK